MPKQDIQALKVRQWISDWDRVEFSAKLHRKKPLPFFYLFSMPAAQLKALSGIQRRTATQARLQSPELGIQRRHEESRSKEISRFVRFGYPWSDLPEPKRHSDEFRDLRMPGWLPTAVVVNILTADDRRRVRDRVASPDLLQIADHDGDKSATIKLPKSFTTSSWEPSDLHPIEVIDGQHRLWAFEGPDVPNDFELPVVAFYGLDISWQAYLFWTINIKPKRINASLAFDLYPLLRSEEWLERFEGHSIYRQTRAQELTEMLWSYPESPWYQRINMLGEPGRKTVSQAGWVRSLLATYVRSFEGRNVKIGGLFGAPVGEDKLVLAWSRPQQGAFLIYIWQQLQVAVQKTKAIWARKLRSEDSTLFSDAAFDGPSSLLNQDQGVRAVLHVTNDLCFVAQDNLQLREWVIGDRVENNSQETQKLILKSLTHQPVAKYIKEIAASLAEFDWRASTSDSLTEKERFSKLVFRGSGGYSEFRKQLLKHVADSAGRPAKAAKEVLQTIED